VGEIPPPELGLRLEAELKMLPRLETRKVAQGAAVATAAVALKAFYSTASANDLRWVLAPTACLAGFVSGETFTFEGYAGYMSSDGSFLIAAPCAGLNFLIAAFLMLSVLWLWREGRIYWTFLPSAFALAYVTTIVANTVRIAAALELHRMVQPMIWVNPEELHRIEGILVYFGFLLVLYVIADSFLRDEPRTGGRMVAWSLLPLGIYWATTLGIPLINGAHEKHARFLEHAAFVIVTPTLLMLPLLIAWLVKRRRARLAFRSTCGWSA
jgi:exosortase K